MVDGLGVTGVEGAKKQCPSRPKAYAPISGVFRKACEVTLQILRTNQDSLMSILESFVADPLVEWSRPKKKVRVDPSSKGRLLNRNSSNNKTT